ncbi:hypothetical protein PCANC_09939 [Puccinia coronata f. sp. avenae]|uniref:Gamma tubulin complex component C-terminal domain-containing protein n=1 Tax=Puccinia coronata f. sp. avenae TaxID=200324 RepID=A0A2N5V2X8_9BASI|nr:hypothetical protein PCANC_09939 [Puccinia coronata f. sp. avenae]
MEKYMRMFRILWKLKRLQYALDRAWKLVILGVTRGLQHLHFLRDDFHHARLVISEMIHFTRQLQAYCHLEVIDCGWQELEKKLTSEGGDLDSLIDAHNAYLDRLVSKGLLLSSRVGKENTCLVLAEECFKVILAFKSSIDNLYAFAQAESARIQWVQKSGGRRAGKYGRMDSSDDDDDEGYVEDNGGSGGDDEEGGQDGGRSTSDEGSLADRSSAMRLEGLRASWRDTRVGSPSWCWNLISSLSTQQDSDMKFLAVRLNFSLFYMRTSKASSSAAATAATTTTTTATTTTTTTTTTALSAPRPLPRSASSTRLPSASAAAAVARSTLTHHKLPASFSSASAAAAHNKRFTQ